MRIAFTLIGGKNWTGGYNYLLNLLTVLSTYEKNSLSPVLFLGEEVNSESIDAFNNVPDIELVFTPLLNAERRTSSLLQALLLGNDISLKRLFNDKKIDILFESAQFFGWRLKIPTIAWIPDFQHKLSPHLFSNIARLKREIGFRTQVLGGRTIMLSSNDARDDCEHYYPSTRGRTYTVPFAIQPNSLVPFGEARVVADSYDLPDKYFFMPNQFWRHKNHGLVLDALMLLKNMGMKVTVVASGKQSDPRDPSYFPTLKARIEKAGLQDSLRLLGMIPYSHLTKLMQTSCALLNPSLFEGWSTTVEEARAIGTPMILSDLDVHLEQMGADAIYFNRYSPQSLAEALIQFKPLDKETRELKAQKAKEFAVARAKVFAQNFVKTAQHCKQSS